MNKILRILKYVFLISYSLISIFPFLWMIISSTNKSVDIMKGSFLPGGHFLHNIKALFLETAFLNVFFNSIIIAAITTILGLIITSLAGYAFEIYNKSNREWLFTLLISAMMIPFSTIMIPLFSMIAKMHLMDTMVGVIIPTILISYLVLYFRQNTKMFITSIIESARIDGLSEFQIFTKIYMPIMKNAYSAAAIVAFNASWNSFLWPLIILQTPDKMTLPVLLSSISSVRNPNYGVVMAALFISTIPNIILFLFLQKKFISQIFGAVK